MTLNVDYGRAFLVPSGRYPGTESLDHARWKPYLNDVEQRLGLKEAPWMRALDEYAMTIEAHQAFLAAEVLEQRLRLIAVIKEVAVTPLKAEWFVVAPSHLSASPIWKTPPKHHWVDDAGRIACTNFAMAAMKDHACTGIEGVSHFQNSPKSKTQWLCAYATQPIGRGLDHPWIDASAWDASEKNCRCKKCRRGVAYFSWTCTAQAGVPKVVSVMRELGAFGSATMLPRLLRRALPKTDFGYSWHQNPHACRIIDDLDDAIGLRSNRVLMCSRRARSIMIEAGHAKAADFIPAVVTDEPEANQVVLDDSEAPIPLPSLTPQEQESRSKTTPAINDSQGAAESPLAIEEIEKQLREMCGPRTRVLAESTESAARAAEREGITLPYALARLMPALGERLYRVNDDFVEFVRPEDLHKFTDDESPALACCSDPVPPGLVAFGSVGNGDAYYLATQSLRMPEDCEVTLFNHETSQFVQEWTSLQSFFTELVKQTKEQTTESR